MTRIAVGKAVGLALGAIGFSVLQLTLPDVDAFLPWAVLFWYATLGAIIGVYGVIAWHPILQLPLPWWVRAPVIGGWMNCLIVLFAHDNLLSVLSSLLSGVNGIVSPFWFVAEGALAGLIIGFFATRFGGEGKHTLDGLEA
ncbi:MAG: hypothetical protein AAGL24_00515 [Pseudomonadota bacterium]